MTDYTDFCNTERQAQVMRLHMQGLGSPKIARELKCDESNIRKTIRKIKERAAEKGFDPSVGLDRPVAAHERLKGRSQLVNEQTGETVLTWYKTSAEQLQAEEAIPAMIEGFKDEIPRIPKSKRPKLVKSASDYMNSIMIGDPHLDMLAYDKETGANWDSDIAYNQHRIAVTNLINRAPPAEVMEVCVLGDSLHRDSLKALTPGSGNLVDVDGRLSRSLRVAVKLFRECITTALEKSDKVVFSIARGNHSETLELCLSMMMQIAFEKDPRVEVLDNTCKHIPYTFGDNFILTTHRDRMNDQRLADVATAMFRAKHGGAKFTHVRTGHLHHAAIKEVSGCLVETFQALPTPDAWHTESGYVSSDQAVNLVTYHKKGGIVGRMTEYPRIFMDGES